MGVELFWISSESLGEFVDGFLLRHNDVCLLADGGNQFGNSWNGFGVPIDRSGWSG